MYTGFGRRIAGGFDALMGGSLKSAKGGQVQTRTLNEDIQYYLKGPKAIKLTTITFVLEECDKSDPENN